ncbi:MAG: hypothetical protein ABIH34_00290 [Nanoarchaeota archaeon]
MNKDILPIKKIIQLRIIGLLTLPTLYFTFVFIHNVLSAILIIGFLYFMHFFFIQFILGIPLANLFKTGMVMYVLDFMLWGGVYLVFFSVSIANNAVFT